MPPFHKHQADSSAVPTTARSYSFPNASALANIFGSSGNDGADDLAGLYSVSSSSTTQEGSGARAGILPWSNDPQDRLQRVIDILDRAQQIVSDHPALQQDDVAAIADDNQDEGSGNQRSNGTRD